MKLILIGYMGSGKTTLGEKLARKLDLRFLDSDHLVESLCGQTIPELFAQHGEARFRELEKEVVDQLFEQDDFVLSCGGGLPCFNDQMTRLKELGTTIYLQRPAKELVQRLSHSSTDRPLIAGKSDEELLEFVTESLEKRRHYYEQAEVIVPRTSGTAKQLYEFLVANQKI